MKNNTIECECTLPEFSPDDNVTFPGHLCDYHQALEDKWMSEQEDVTYSQLINDPAIELVPLDDGRDDLPF